MFLRVRAATAHVRDRALARRPRLRARNPLAARLLVFLAVPRARPDRRERRQRRRRHRHLRLGRGEVRLRPALDDDPDHGLADRRPGDGRTDGRGDRKGALRADPRAVRRPLVGCRDGLGAGREPRDLHQRVRRDRRRARPRRDPVSGLGADRRGRDLAARRPRLLEGGRAGVRADDDPVLRLPDRGDPRKALLGRRRSLDRRAAPPAELRLCPPLHRHRGDDDHAVHAAVRPVGGRRARDRSRRAERRAYRGRGRLDLRQHDRPLHHDRDRRDPLRPPRAHREQRRRRRQGARSVRRPLRRAAVRDRSPRREPARRGNPPRDGRVRGRRDVRLREGDEAPAARGTGLRRCDHRPDSGRHARRDHPRAAGDRPARGRPGRERLPAAGHARSSSGGSPRTAS